MTGKIQNTKKNSRVTQIVLLLTLIVWVFIVRKCSELNLPNRFEMLVAKCSVVVCFVHMCVLLICSATAHFKTVQLPSMNVDEYF